MVGTRPDMCRCCDSLQRAMAELLRDEENQKIEQKFSLWLTVVHRQQGNTEANIRLWYCALKLFPFHILLRNSSGSLKSKSVLLFCLIVFFCKEKASKTLSFRKNITDHGEWNCKGCSEWKFLFHERDWAGSWFWQGTTQDHERIGGKSTPKTQKGTE